mgnify:CR=1 FL=1
MNCAGFAELTNKELLNIDGGLSLKDTLNTVAYYAFTGGMGALGAAVGAAIGSAIAPGPGTAVGAGIGARAGAIIGTMIGAYVGDKIWDATH